MHALEQQLGHVEADRYLARVDLPVVDELEAALTPGQQLAEDLLRLDAHGVDELLGGQRT